MRKGHLNLVTAIKKVFQMGDRMMALNETSPRERNHFPQVTRTSFVFKVLF